jgi:uncharacterized ParB-like nuclease family protein
MKTLKLEEIRIDGGTQTRAEINNEAVAEYAEAVLEGAKFPPVDVFFDGVSIWLADGFHRYHAHRRAKVKDIQATFHTGSVQDALMFALSANTKNGLRRTNADKRKCVEIALDNFADWSDRRIAEVCGVSDKTVSKVRLDTCGNSAPEPEMLPTGNTAETAPESTRKGKDGKSYPAPKPAPIPEEAKAAGEEAAKDSENLWVLKSTWRKASKKDRTAFFKWVHEQQTH